MKLQSRLALTCCILVIPVLVGLSLGVYFITQGLIHNAVDNNLETTMNAVDGVLRPRYEDGGRTVVVDANLRSLDRLAAQGAIFEIRALDGSVFYSSRSSGFPSPAGAANQGLTTIEVGGEPMRSLNQIHVQNGSPLALVEVRQPLAATNSALGKIRLALAAGGAIAALTIVTPAYWLAGRAVAPVRKASELALAIEATADFSQRLPRSASPREIRDLGTAFNALLDRIEAMIAAQRTFFAESSHELRRPLTILRTNIDVLGLPTLPDGERVRVQEEMRSEAASMTRLLTELLLLSREGISARRHDVVNFSAVVERSVAQARDRWPKHVLLSDIEPGLYLEGDQERLPYLVDNLIENAHLYTPEQGNVEVRVRKDGDCALLEVNDSGVGMTPSDQSHAFERFFRGQAGRNTGAEGFGLGLSIVKQVVELHSGRVALASSPGTGTSCVVRLPLAILDATLVR